MTRKVALIGSLLLPMACGLCGSLRAAERSEGAPFQPVSFSQDHRTLQLDRSFIGEPLKIGSRGFDRGLGTHANSHIIIDLGPGCCSFCAAVGVDLNSSTREVGGSVVFAVNVDGQERFRSEVLRPGMEPVDLSVSVLGAKRLELIAETTDDGYLGDHADWGDARLVLADGRQVVLSQEIRRQGLPRQSAPPEGARGPQEPPTRTLSKSEAKAALERDWLFQAEGAPTLWRTRQEIKWARELAARLAKCANPPDLSQELAELAEIGKRIASSPVLSSQPMTSLPQRLAARWSFDALDGREANDASGSGWHASLSGQAEGVPGVHAAALALTGDGYLATDPKLAAATQGSYTVCAWVNTTAELMDVFGTGTKSGDFLLVVNRTALRGHHWTDSSGNVLDGKARVNDGRWHHVAQVVDDQAISIFVDGKLDVTQKLQGRRVPPSDPILLGARSASPEGLPYRYRGCLDEVCLFGRALSPQELKGICDEGKAGLAKSSQSDPGLYLAVRRVKRRMMFKDPVINFSQVVFADIPHSYPHESMHRVFPMAQDNSGRLLLLDGLHPGGKLQKLAGPEPGMFWRPDLSFDARKVLFCYRPKQDRTFHLYEVGIDGSGLRQVTHGSYDDLDPIYAPDGNILFLSNRGNSYARCAVGHPSYVLSRCDPNGTNLYIISASNEPEYTPSLMPDGRVIYTRWEYTDKELMRVQSLWTMNPDGTGVSVFWGNQSFWPDVLMEARPIPGSHRVMFAGHGHHEVFHGCIGMLDRRLGFNYPEGLTRVTADVAWPEVGNGPAERLENPRYHASGRFAGYKSPYPLSEEVFLVSARTESDRFKLYLMDTSGNRELIYQGAYSVLYALPVRPRPVPPIIPDTVAWPGSEREGRPAEPGVLFSADVFEGLPPILRQLARYVRVINLDYTTFTFGLKTQGPRFWAWRFTPHMHAGPPLSITNNDGIKRILGIVPIEADGSVCIEVPPCRQIHFQLLDEHFRALHTMRSFANVMPGERRGCVGCHESHSVAPPQRNAIALQKPPVRPIPPPWGAQYSLGYERDIQPILDKHCGSCHQGDGKGRAKLDLTLRPSPDAGMFPEPYVTLTLGKRRNCSDHFPSNAEGGIAGTILAMVYPLGPQHDKTIPPMTTLSYRSKLIDIAMSGKHNNVRVDDVSLQKLIVWVDTLCPYLGEKEIREMPDPDPTIPFYANSDYPPRTPGIRPFADSPYPPRMRTAPIVNRAYCQDDFPTQADRLRGPQQTGPTSSR